MSNRKVIFYLVDGARPDVLYRLADEGQLPHIKQHLIDNGSSTIGTTCFPSTTGPAYLPYLCGTFPGDHGITGIRWFDKAEYFRGRWGRNSMRSYCGYEAKYFDDDMDSRYPSLFETYDRGFNIYNMIVKGVKEENDLTKKGKSGLYLKAHYQHKHHAVDEAGHKKLMEALDKDPQFIYAVFPSVDWDSHSYHDEDERTIEAYKIADRSVGEVVDKLKAKGEYEDTLIVMASDHGLTSTHTHFDLGRFWKKAGYRVLEYPNIMKIRPQVAVFISGNSFGTVSFLDQEEMYVEDLLEKRYGESLAAFVTEPAIDFILYRKSDSSYIVRNQEGKAEIKVEGKTVSYTALTGNPFGIRDTIKLLDEKAAFDHCFESDYPDGLWQVKQLMESPRSGDVVVSAAVGYDLRDFWEYPAHNGSHGSLHKDHIHIPILVSQPGLLPEPVRSTAVYRLIRNWLDQNDKQYYV